MAKGQPEEIQLPWRPTVDGAMAELGAIFRVELVGGDWRCSVKSGRCQTIIAKGLKTQAEGKRRAQAHAATMPEVRDAKKESAAAVKPRAKKPAASRRSRKPREESREAPRAATEPTSATSPPTTAPAPLPSATTAPSITFHETEDGCLCGKTQGVCWVANETEVALARPLPDPVKEQIAAAVAQHYAARRAASEPATPAPARARSAARTVAKKAAKRTIKKIAKKAVKKAAKARTAREEKPARDPKKDSATSGRKASRGRGKKAARGKRAEQKEEAPVNGKPKDADDTPAAAPAPAKRRGKPAAEARRGKRATETATPTGPIAWSEVDGKPRGAAAHGTFLIEPEGQGFGLYFADASGQSRHLRSGSIPDLRRAAEELAARGEPAPLRDAPSREQDEALMRIFASGAVEGA